MRPVDNIRQLALKLFETEKNHLLEEKQEYFCETATSELSPLEAAGSSSGVPAISKRIANRNVASVP